MVLAKKFIDENLAEHWQVNKTNESFKRLLYHLEIKSNFKPHFEKALKELRLDDREHKDGVVVADIGAGVCWTSAILANIPCVKYVYAVEASENRLKHAKFVLEHFNVSKEKFSLLKGTFSDLKIPEMIDIFVLCGSLHHCYDKDIPDLFKNIRRLLKKNGMVLIANEHYVNFFWILKRFVSYIKNFSKRDTIGIYLSNLRAPHPFDGEHWRTRQELEDIFRREGFNAQFFLHKEDLCKDKPTFYHTVGWYYYYAVLERTV